jgi:hypothetical protein
VIVAANAVIIAATLLATLSVPAGTFVAVVVPPWRGAEAAISTVAVAGGTLVASAGVDWIVIAHAQDRAFASRLRQAGAWLVLNHAVLSGCFKNNRTAAIR